MSTSNADQSLESLALEPLVGVGRRFLFLVAGLLVVVAIGGVAYAVQLAEGLQVTGMAPTVNKVMWGIYIINFVFFIGISHAGTLISAILRVSQAEWRRPITRMAEFITVVALSVGALMPIFDLGRPDRIPNLFVYGRWNSPILWDFFSITTYLFGSLIYLYLPLIPDLALCRDRLSARVSRPKRWLFHALAAEWRGTPGQRAALARALTLMMVLIIPIAVSVHTVVSWIFGMTLRIGWNSTVFGIYFVAGAIFSGTATLIIVMAILRRVFRLGAYIPDRQFVNLGYLLAALSVVMLYFNLSEYVTAGYKLEEGEAALLGSILVGAFAPWYWFYVLGGLVLPALLMLAPWTRTFWGVLAGAVLADVAMWVERYIIVVSTLRTPQMPYTDLAGYVPTWVELAITAGAFALFALLIALFAKLVPIVSIWEVREHEAEAGAEPRPGAREAVPRVPRPAVGLGIVVLAALLAALLPGAASAGGRHEKPKAGAAAEGPAPHGMSMPSGAREPTWLALAIAGDVRLGEPVRLRATLTTAAGRPVPGAAVRFLMPSAWGEIDGDVDLGSVKTDAEGLARLAVPARRSGAVEFRARFEGGGRLGPSSAVATVTVAAGGQLYQPRMPVVSVRASGLAPWLLGAALATVWSLYLVVARLVLTIARASDLPAPASTGVTDIGRRRFFQRLVPAGMHAAIAPVGLGLVGVIARSPYTHDNLEGHRPGRGYRRTPYAHVGERAPMPPLPPALGREVSFAREVLPILLANAGPHVVPPKSSPPPRGIRLDSYEGIMAKEGLVVPGKPDRSELVRVLVDPAMRMPPSIPPLPADQVRVIVSWVAQGAKNN